MQIIDTDIRELTLEELDAELAEQLPARELMGSLSVSVCTPCVSCEIEFSSCCCQN